jgi:hypothetical protein
VSTPSPSLTDVTGPVPVGRLIFALASRSASGALRVDSPGRVARIGIDSGWVHAMSNVGIAGHDGPARLLGLLEQLPEAARASFDATAKRDEVWGRVPPFHPGRTLRAWFDRADDGATLDLRARVRLVLDPHPSTLDPDEAVLLPLLRAGLRLEELARHAHPALGQDRRARLVSFLRRAGALVVEDPAREAALRLLGLDEGGDREAVRRAYHRLARELHPDLNPRAGDQPDARDERLRALNDAYRLLGG